ncbi:UNVERIFIED_CONTAM: hypothetical protein RMT77_019759 [Armadillidium vulgare]
MDVSNVLRWVRKATLSNKGEMSITMLREVAAPLVITDQHHARVDDIIWGNLRIKQSEIASILAISKERVQAIITDLKYRKIHARYAKK